MEPFLPTIFSHGTEESSAYPVSRARGLLPLNLDFSWPDNSDDAQFRAAIVSSAQQITRTAIADGQDVADAPLYGNYAIDTTPISRIFGAKMPALKALKFLHDPHNVMGLAGGWKL